LTKTTFENKLVREQGENIMHPAQLRLQKKVKVKEGHTPKKHIGGVLISLS